MKQDVKSAQISTHQTKAVFPLKQGTRVLPRPILANYPLMWSLKMH